jgi:predicted amidohydrolase YtcJ
LTDCHSHFLGTTRAGLPVSELVDGKLKPDSIDGVREKIIQYAETLDPKSPIICSNYIISSVREDRFPYRKELDSWLPGRNIVLFSIDGHSCSMSSTLLKNLKFNYENHDGIFLGEYLSSIVTKMNEFLKKHNNFNRILKEIEHTLNYAVGKGIVGIHCMENVNIDKNNPTVWFFKKIAPYLPVYFRLYSQQRDLSLIQSLSLNENMLNLRAGGCGGWMMDGAVGSKTAAFYSPYLNNPDPDNIGKLYFPRNKLLKSLKYAQNHGFQISSHAIGTRAIDRIVNAFGTILVQNKDFTNNLRHRIDHFEFPTKQQVEFAIETLKLLVVPQPGFSWMSENLPGMNTYQKYLKREIIEMQVPLKTIYETGGIICGSSDSPVQPLDPWLQIQGMVNFPISKERLSVYQALRTYTYNAAYATFEEETRGTISVGKWADFIVMSRNNDPFKVPKDKLIDLKVDETYIQGQKVWEININKRKILTGSLFKKKNCI